MNLIVVVDENWGIGQEGQLLCHLPSDLKYFRKTTLGSRVVMGRKTLESFPNGNPLPKRENIVLTRNKGYQKDGVTLCGSVEELEALLGADETSTFVIGGGSIYKQLLPYCDKAYITRIYRTFPADTHFPNLDAMPEEWALAEKGERQEENGIAFSFDIYERVK